MSPGEITRQEKRKEIKSMTAVAEQNCEQQAQAPVGAVPGWGVLCPSGHTPGPRQRTELGQVLACAVVAMGQYLGAAELSCAG